jgi:hypothetical protein
MGCQVMVRVSGRAQDMWALGGVYVGGGMGEGGMLPAPQVHVRGGGGTPSGATKVRGGGGC